MICFTTRPPPLLPLTESVSNTVGLHSQSTLFIQEKYSLPLKEVKPRSLGFSAYS